MISNAKIVEQIRKALADPEGMEYDKLSEIAKDYGAACDRLNGLLSTAIAYYTTGFYCEAARIAKEENLLQEYQTLLFPDVDSWRDVCRGLGWEIKANISTVNGTELQTFLMSYEAHADLFARNRRLALADAPAEERLEVLYQLVALFPENPGLIRSINALEGRRDREIGEFASSLTPSNATREAVRACLDELESPSRRTPPSQETVERLRTAETYLVDVERKEELRFSIAEWSDALERQDENEALAHLNQYREFLALNAEKADEYYASLSVEEQSNLKAAVAFSESAERKRALDATVRRRAFELENAINAEEGESAVENALSRLEQAAAAAGRPNMPQVSERARVYLDATHMKNRRKTLLTVSLILTLVAGFIAAAATATYQNVSKKKARAFAEEISQTLAEYENGDVAALERVEKQIARMRERDSRLERSPEVEKVFDRFDSLKAQETKRVGSYEDLVAKLTDAHSNGRSDYTSLASLKNVAKTESEKRKYNELAREDNQLRVKNRSAADEKFSAELAVLKAKFDALKERGDLTDADLVTGVTQLKSGLTELERSAQLSNVSEGLATSLKTLASAVDAFERERTRAGFADALARTIGNAAGYRSELDRVFSALKVPAERIVATNAAVEFTASVDAWNNFVTRFGSKSSEWTKDDAALEGVLKYVENNRAKLAVMPEWSKLEGFIAPLTEEGQSTDIGAFFEELRQAFADYATRYWTLYHEETERYYYLVEEIKYGDDRMVEYRPSLDGEQRMFNSSFMEEEDTVTQSLQYRLYNVIDGFAKKAPSQTEFAGAVQNIMTLVATAKETELDPALKAVMLYKLLLVVCKEEKFSSLREWREKFEAEPSFRTDVDFYNQRSEGYEEFQTLAKKLTRDFTPAAIEAKFAEFKAGGGSEPDLELPQYKWVGFVDAAEGSYGVTFGGGASPVDGAALWIARSESAPQTLTEIGKCINGGANVRVELTEADRWTPVYMTVNE